MKSAAQTVAGGLILVVVILAIATAQLLAASTVLRFIASVGRAILGT